MDYRHYSKIQLIQMIKELQVLNCQLPDSKEPETKLDFSWNGNLGFWNWNVKTNTVTFNLLKATTLGYTKEEIPENVPYQFFTDKIHPDDYPRVMEIMTNHLHGKSSIYEVEYRIQAKNNDYKWYYDLGKITKFDDEGKPLFMAGVVFDVTEKTEMQLDFKGRNQLLSELSMLDGLRRVKSIKDFFEHLTAEIKRGLRLDIPMFITMTDLDAFKDINDIKADLYGDAILINVPQIMESQVLNIDFAGQYCREEFMIIFPKSSGSVARCVSERIRQALEKDHFEGDISINVSGGADGFLFASVKTEALYYRYLDAARKR